ncbi:hypothetical protein SAMN02745866_00805 [Alteromonadaceae bacterium Bs31]|nr:hypothetical protein SAMN02745866_00805 [Alteromonadaceae bacterium Bs31]
MKKFSVLLILSVTAHFASAQQFIFPAKDQTPEQQAVDEKACDDWASNQVGTSVAEIDSQIAAAKSATVPGGVPQASAGAGGRGAVRGAVIGSAIGHATDNNRTEAAAVGAVIGASRAKRRSAEANAAQQQAQQQASTQLSVEQLEAKRSDFFKARGTCLTAKGYTISN